MQNNMSHRGRKSRPLGSVRASLTGIESIPRLPPLGVSSSIDSSYTGIHGNAMGTPVTRGSPERPEREVHEKPKGPPPVKIPSRNPSSSSRSEGGKSDDGSVTAATAAADKKELKDSQVREKLLQAEIASLRKIIAGLEMDIQEKIETNEDLEEKLKNLTSSEFRYKSLYETELRLHNGTKDVLTSTKNALSTKEKQINDLEEKHERELKEINSTMEKRLDELEKSKNVAIATLEGKLNKLKSHMADALQGNSWERQQQLDELSRELSRATEESEMLRAKLRAMAKNGTKQGNPGCANCESLTARVQHLDRTVTEKDKALRELKVVCGKFEKQLKQKDILSQLTGNRNLIK